MASKQAKTVPQFTIVLDQHATKDGATKWSEVEFSHASERGTDSRMTHAESVAFNDLFVCSLFSITNPESVKHHRCDYNAPLFHWWDEFIRGPLRNVRIGSDEFRNSRAALIDASLMRHIREAAQLSFADFQSLSLVEVFDLIDGIKIREHNAANLKKAAAETIDQLKADDVLLFGMTIHQQSKTVTRRDPLGVKRTCAIVNLEQWDLFNLAVKHEGKLSKAQVRNQLPNKDERNNTASRLRTRLQEIQLTFNSVSGFYILKEFSE